MIFTADELTPLIPRVVNRRPASYIREQLHLLAPLLSGRDGAYKAFGPFWWTIKALLKEYRIGTRNWFHGSALDSKVYQAMTLGNPAQDLFSALYYRELHDHFTLSLDEIHLITWPDGRSELYEASDPDGSHQLDLFDHERLRAEREARFIQEPGAYLPRPWRERGDAERARGRLWRAAVCYKRAASSSYGPETREKEDAWLLLAETFEELGHWSKAYFCYETLYTKSKENWLRGAMAKVLLEDGKPGLALELYNQALLSSPGNPELQAGKDMAQRKLEKTAPGPGERGLELNFRARAS